MNFKNKMKRLLWCLFLVSLVVFSVPAGGRVQPPRRPARARDASLKGSALARSSRSRPRWREARRGAQRDQEQTTLREAKKEYPFAEHNSFQTTRT